MREVWASNHSFCNVWELSSYPERPLAKLPAGPAFFAELGKRTAYSADRWFLAQTNYDPWAKDEPTDARRTAAVELLSSGGQNRSATPAGLLAIAASYPVKNADTAYTALLDASMGTVDAWVHSVPMVPTSG